MGQERTNVGQWLREAEQQDKKRKEYKQMKSTIEEMEKCEDDEEFGCSSKKKDDCNWICTKMASAKGGVDMDKVDMKDQESMDGSTKYTKTRRRVLSGNDVTVGNEVSSNDSDGYEAD